MYVCMYVCMYGILCTYKFIFINFELYCGTIIVFKLFLYTMYSHTRTQTQIIVLLVQFVKDKNAILYFFYIIFIYN